MDPINFVEKIQEVPQSLKNANKEQLEHLLQKATVSTGHWNGSQISFEDESQKATFSQLSAKIEEIYSKSVDFMRIRQANYEWSQKPTKQHGFGLVGLVLSAPGMLIEAGLKTLSSQPPKLSEAEVQQVKNAIQWRQDRYAQLNKLFQQSQDQLNTDSSYLGKLWNKACDKMGSWKEVLPTKDNETLEKMILANKNR